MNIPSLVEIASTDRVLNSLGLAIAEARMTRSLIRRKLKPHAPESSAQYAEKLQHLDREIDFLEAEITAVRLQLDQG